MKKQLLIGWAMVVFSGTGLRGQILDADAILNPSPDLSGWTDAGKRSGVFITQTGNLNDAQVIQTLGSAPVQGNTNLVRVLQQGEANLVQINAVGQQNQVDALQNGSGNSSVSNITGNANLTRLVQNGSKNTLIQTLVNSNNIKTDFQQNGDNNRIEQEVKGQTNLPFRIIQNGNGLNAIVRQIN